MKGGAAISTVTHVLVSNFVYELPFGKGKSFLSGLNGIGDAIFGGWGINGIYIFPERRTILRSQRRSHVQLFP